MKKTLQIEGFKTLFDKDDLLSSIDGQNILGKIRKNKLKFNCICQGVEIPLEMHVRRIVRNTNYHYVIVRNRGTMDKHDPDCNNFGMIKLSDEELEEDKNINEYDDKIAEIENVDLFDDEIYVNKKVTSEITEGILQPLLFITDNHLEKNLSLPTSKNSDTKNHSKKRYRYSEMFSIGENIIFHAWHNYVMKTGYNPNIEKLFKNIYEDSNSHRIGKDNIISINDIMFKPYGKARYENINEVIKKAFLKIHHQNNANYNMYILGKILSNKILPEDDNFTILTVEDPQKKNYFNLLIETSRFNNSIGANTSKADKLISCFVSNSDNRFMEVESFAFIPIAPKIGVSVESNYEIDFAEHLVKNNILFVKPPKSSNPYSSIFGSSNNPDFLLIDKNCMKEATIVEVFGYDKKLVESADFIKKYWEKAMKKIDYYKSLKDYNFFYWLAYKNPLPTVYPPKKKEIK